MEKFLPAIGLCLFIIALDVYAFQAVKTLLPSESPVRKWLSFLFWGFTIYSLLGFLYFRLLGNAHLPRLFILFNFSTFFIVYLSKLILCLFLLLEDTGRLSVFAFSWLKKIWQPESLPFSPGRSAAISKIALGIAALPFFSLIYGMIKGAYNYKIHQVALGIRNLPEAFKGLKIVQISDVHAGSFYDKKAVEKGIQKIIDLKPDLIFFTGDLVNNEAEEFRDYLEVFQKLQAPLGVYSILGNHDYGDYRLWPSDEAKRQNLEQLKEFQKSMGWKLLLDEHVKIEKDGSEMALIGVQNWSARGRFPKYGNLKKAYAGSESAPVKLLLSHDPSHWEAQVIGQFPDINVMFAGHTHGMQFGVEIPGFKWSPVQYVYKQWAGLYESGNQKLYVNRGFGFIGYPGRVGILPEISVFTLSAG
jgi:predicted MPP superfamily phosphohydrolase